MPRRINDELLDRLERAFIDARMLGNIAVTKRSTLQDTKYKQAVDLLNLHLKDFFLDLTEKDFDLIRVANFVELRNVTSTLHNPRAEVPAMGVTSLDEESLQRLIRLMYERHSTVHGMLEELEPMMVRWDAIMKRAERIMKGLCLGVHEWEGESFFHVFVPQDVHQNYTELKERVEECRQRDNAFTTAYEKLSRYITTMQTDPQAMNRPINPDAEQPKEVTGVRPSWRDKYKKVDE